MKLRFVQFEVPYDTWKTPFTQQLFGKLVELKLDGYQTAYPYGILPVDVTDFAATHLLICQEPDIGIPTPIASYKSITLKRCGIHRIPFPCLGILQSSGAMRHYEGVQALIQKYQDTPEQLSYESGFTIHPNARKDKAFSAELKNMLMAFATSYGEASTIECFLGMGMTKVKADQYFYSWGYKPFAIGDEILPTVPVKSYFLEDSRLLQTDGFSALAKENARKYQALWKDRLILSDDQASTRKVAA
jgi:hypothetical protein